MVYCVDTGTNPVTTATYLESDGEQLTTILVQLYAMHSDDGYTRVAPYTVSVEFNNVLYPITMEVYAGSGVLCKPSLISTNWVSLLRSFLPLGLIRLKGFSVAELP